MSYQSGFVAIIGAPNVGKSTLMNALLGQKISIVSPKPQTTRNRILGVKHLPGGQIIFLDTPGIFSRHQPAGSKHSAGGTENIERGQSGPADDRALFRDGADS